MKYTRMLAAAMALLLCFAAVTGCSQKQKDTDQLMGEAMLAYQCFMQFSLKVNETITGEVEIDGRPMRQVMDTRFSSLEDLRTYAETYFSDEICDRLLSQGHYVEHEGKLYSDNFDYALNQSIAQVEYREAERSEDRVLYQAVVTRIARNAAGEEVERLESVYDYPYQKTDRGWVFVDFPYFWEG